jgi:hypothetical protein
VSLLIALLLAQAAPEAAAVETEIVVLAHKLGSTRFVWEASDKSGTWKLSKCQIKESSGDKVVDAITCKAVEQCLHTLPLGAKQAPPQFNACLGERRGALVAELAAQRAAALDPES